jgi:hypothetical protein
VHEELANKATMLCKHATFAYTGLAQCSVIERTDELLLRCLAKPVALDAALSGLAKEAGQAIRGLRLNVLPSQRRAVRRTSFVGAGFLGMRNPGNVGRRPSGDELHPFLAVVSNAQDLTEQWRPQADQDFSVHIGFLDERQPFLLHAAGQPFTGPLRTGLVRTIRRSLSRIDQPETLARLLARAVRDVAARNQAVGPNVMCTMVRRNQVRSRSGRFSGGMVPLIGELQVEARYFTWPRDGPAIEDPAQFIYSPDDPQALQHYGPNYACGGLRMTGMLFGPVPLPTSRRPPAFIP